MTGEIDLLSEMRDLEARLSDQMRERFSRALPFEELLFDRWQRAERLGFGERTSIYHNAYVMFDVTVGSDCWIGPFVLLDGRGGLQVGDSCHISAGVHVYTHDSIKRALSGGVAPLEVAPVKIGECCHIGSQAVITKGVVVGDHSVIGANAVVTHDVAPYSIVMGSPARQVGTVDVSDDGTVSLAFDSH